MPEISEIARIVHFLRKHLVGKTIANVTAQEDDIIFGKVGTSATAFKKAMTGKKVVGAKQQGKYFWLEMESPPHPLMHFGMSGWMKFSNDESVAYYKPTKPEESSWPPRFWKFILEASDNPSTSVAFVDARRLGRIRLVDVPAAMMRKTSPLKENGPDPVIDKDVLTPEWLVDKCRSKRVPIKALLLDQANISGVGNWVGDEVLYHAGIHPEQYSNSLSDAQLQQLHKSLTYVCTFACDKLADSDQFPEDWLFKHRWGKGKKAVNALPNGDKIVFLTVGGRTSAVVPARQKKTGPVAGDLDKEVKTELENGDETPVKKGKRKSEAVVEDAKEDVDVVSKPAASKKSKTSKAATPNGTSKAAKKESSADGRRRSGRLSRG